MKKLIITLLTATTILSTVKADSIPPVKNYLYVEIDPAPFIYGGYSFSLKFSPARFNHLSLMASVYSSKLPENLIPKENSENGFENLELNTSYAIFTDYFLRDDRKGFHFGPSVFFYSKTVGMKETENDLSFNSIYPNVRLGYLFHPFRKSNFYLNPWFNIGKEFISDDAQLNGKVYKSATVNYIVAVHLGYRFN